MRLLICAVTAAGMALRYAAASAYFGHKSIGTSARVGRKVVGSTIVVPSKLWLQLAWLGPFLF